MAAARPRPNKTSDGTPKVPQPTMTHQIDISPAPEPKPAPVIAPPPPPGAPQPGRVNPMTHPAHPALQSNIAPGAPGAASAPAPPPAPGAPGAQPGQPTGQPASPLDTLHPPVTKNDRQVQERIMFKDLPPVGQAQTMQQQGIDPYAMFELGQQKVGEALQQGPTSGPIPNALTGPGIPQGQNLESFPDDMAHLTTLMSQGYAPGASNQEHGFAMNAHAMANAKIQKAFSDAQQGTGAVENQPLAPPGPQAPDVNPFGPPLGGLAPGAPPAMGPPPGGIMPPGVPPTQPGAPGGIPPAIIAALLAKGKRPAPAR